MDSKRCSSESCMKIKFHISAFHTNIYWAQRDLNPRPTAPQAVILSKLNYEPTHIYLAIVNYKFYSIIYYCISFLLSQQFLQSWPCNFQFGFGLYLKNFKGVPQIKQ